MPLVIILVIAVDLLNFFYLIPPVINWDEGTHALWGFKEWLALRSGDFPLFWELSRAQFAYPPLGSWFIALVNLPFEFSMTLARFVSTLGFIVGGILLFLIGSSLSVKLVLSTITTSLGMTGLVSLFLFLTSPALLFYSVTVFKESWGMALTLLTIYLYFRAVEKKSIKYYFLTGLFLVLLFFEKYNYTLLLVLTLGLEGVVELMLVLARLATGPVSRQPQAFPTRGPRLGLPVARHPSPLVSFILNILAIFLPLFLFSLWWILTPTNKLSWFLDILRSDWNPVTVSVGNSWQYLTFFVQSIRVSYVFSDVLFWGLVVGYLMATRDLWRKKIRVLWLFFTLNFILGTLHSVNLQDRYILTSVPALFLVAGYEWQQVLLTWRVLSTNSPKNIPTRGPQFWGAPLVATRLALLLLILLVLFDLRNFPTLLKSNATHMLLSPMYNESDYKDTLFNFNKDEWPKKVQSETPEGVIDYILDNVDINKPIEIIGTTAEISPDWVELRRQLKLRECFVYGLRCTAKSEQKFMVTIEVKPTSRLYTYDYRRANAWQLAKVREMRGDKLLKEKEFSQLGVVVRIYSL